MASSSSSSSEINSELIDNGKLVTPTLSTETVIEMGYLTEKEITNEMGGGGEGEGEGNLNYYLRLHQAIFSDDWYSVRNFLEINPSAVTIPITAEGETALSLMAKQGKRSNYILERLVELMPMEALTQLDCTGNTALHAAAVLGNVRGAKILVMRDPELPNFFNSDGLLPLHFAATNGHRDVMLFLLNMTRDVVEPNPFEGEPGARLMRSAINYRFYDVALHLLQRYPMLAWQQGFSPLEVIAQEPSAFTSGLKLGFWQRIVYSCILAEMRHSPRYPAEVDMENKTRSFACKKLRAVIWEVLEIIVPQLRNIREMKLLHLQALKLLECLCMEVEQLSNLEASLIFKCAFLLAAQYGIHEVVEEILKSFPSVITSIDEDNRTALHLAVMYRHENVFNVINHLNGEFFWFLSRSLDRYGNNILHLAGYRAQQYQLDLVSSAVLQMQRELQWFQELDRFVLPEQRKQKNNEGLTPLEVFHNEHKDMVAYEGQWMIGMANSCTVATTIIGTLAFAASITVPGGYKVDGSPVFAGGAAFIIFAISDAFALFSSICTLLMFLSILTSRYAMIDHLYSLPNRLIIGLVALFLSITSLIIAFSVTIYLVFAQNNNLILIPIATLALLPVTLFVLLQFPLLLNMMRSTYGSSIFRSFTSNKQK